MNSAFVLLVSCSEYDLYRPDDAGGPPPQDTGTARPADPVQDIEVTPDALELGALGVGCEPAVTPVTIANVGAASLEVFDIRLQGSGTGDAILTGGPLVLGPGESSVVDLSLTPSIYGIYAFDLQVESDDPDEELVVVPVTAEGVAGARVEEAFVQSERMAVDLLWVVDNSGSMQQVKDRVREGFEAFIAAWTTLEVDWQLAVITTDTTSTGAGEIVDGVVVTPSTPDAEQVFLDLVDRGTSGSASERGTDAVYKALTEPLLSSANAGFLREGAALGVIVVTDEDDSSVLSESTFVSWLDGLKGDRDLTSLSAICGGKLLGCIDFTSDIWADPGDRYIRIQEATGGAWGSVCETDYAGLLGDMALAQAPVATRFLLSGTPEDPSRIEVTVDGVAVTLSAIDGYTYDSVDNAVDFHGEGIPEPGSTVVVSYTASPCAG